MSMSLTSMGTFWPITKWTMSPGTSEAAVRLVCTPSELRSAGTIPLIESTTHGVKKSCHTLKAERIIDGTEEARKGMENGSNLL
jgi:hypothetical protein